MSDVRTIMFWLTIAFMVVSVAMAVAGIWLPSSVVGRKLFFTALTLAGGSALMTLAMKWLG